MPTDPAEPTQPSAGSHGMTTYSRPLTPGEQQTLDRISDITWRAAEHLQALRDESAAREADSGATDHDHATAADRSNRTPRKDTPS